MKIGKLQVLGVVKLLFGVPLYQKPEVRKREVQYNLYSETTQGK